MVPKDLEEYINKRMNEESLSGKHKVSSTEEPKYCSTIKLSPALENYVHMYENQ